MRKKDLKKVKLSDEANSRILGRFKSELNIDVDKIYKDLERQNLLQEERPKKSKKPLVLAISCTLVVAVAGIIIGNELGYHKLIRNKNVDALNLDGDDYCLAFYYGNGNFSILGAYSDKTLPSDNIYREHYLVNDDDVDKLITIDANGVKEEYIINLPKSFDEILINYNDTYNNILDLNRLNDDDYGLLFKVLENELFFYIFNRKDKVYSVNI